MHVLSEKKEKGGVGRTMYSIRVYCSCNLLRDSFFAVHQKSEKKYSHFKHNLSHCQMQLNHLTSERNHNRVPVTGLFLFKNQLN